MAKKGNNTIYMFPSLSSYQQNNTFFYFLLLSFLRRHQKVTTRETKIKMYPLLFLPFQSDKSSDQLNNLPVSYDLKCSEEFGCGAMNVTIYQKINIGEPTYNVTINTVKV